MPIGVQTPITSHTGNGTATVFAYEFAILSADDIKVKVDGSIVTTGFTVAGIGDRDGGTVTFSVAPGSGIEVLLYREVSRERATDYQYAGDLREDVLDDDLDRIVMALQEDAELIARGIRVPVGESLSELPAAASRVDKVLTFGAGGAIALVDVAAFAGGGVVELVPADGSITMTKLATAVQSLINGALQKSGGTMTGAIVLSGNAANALEAVPKQQAESLIATAVSNRLQFSLSAIQATTSGTAIDFTGIPAGAKRITVMLSYVSGSASGSVKIRALVGGSEVSTGYLGTYFFYGSGSSAGVITDAFCQYDLTNATTNIHGATVLTFMGSNTWTCNGAVARHGGTAEFQQHAGSTVLAGDITGIRLLCSGGTFDGGSASILVEY